MEGLGDSSLAKPISLTGDDRLPPVTCLLGVTFRAALSRSGGEATVQEGNRDLGASGGWKSGGIIGIALSVGVVVSVLSLSLPSCRPRMSEEDEEEGLLGVCRSPPSVSSESASLRSDAAGVGGLGTRGANGSTGASRSKGNGTLRPATRLIRLLLAFLRLLLRRVADAFSNVEDDLEREGMYGRADGDAANCS